MRKSNLALATCATMLWTGTALATQTTQQNCDYARITAWKVYQSCVDAVVAKDAKSVAFDEFKALWSCRHIYFKKWRAFQGNPAYLGSSCDQAVPAIGSRFTDNGDGTVTDNLTGLVWELKTNDSSVHDGSNTYSWSTGLPYAEDGTAFTTFLTTGLNTPGFAGSNGWRLPTLAELQTILADFPCTGMGWSATCSCPSRPCIAFSDSNTQSNRDGSATSFVKGSALAWYVGFASGDVGVDSKASGHFERAVRGGF